MVGTEKSEENHNCDNETPLPVSPGTVSTPKHLVIAMDGLREFNLMLLAWALAKIEQPCIVTILGILPWLNLPLRTKIWLDDWADAKHLKIQAAKDLCRKYGVVPRMKVAMGYPLQLMVVEQIVRLEATWVVFDRHCGNVHNKRIRKYYTERIPCTIMTINNKGDVDLIKGRSTINIEEEQNTPGQSPASSLPTPEVIISKEMQGHFVEERDDKDDFEGASSSIN